MALYKGTYTISLLATLEGGYTFAGMGATPWNVSYYQLHDDPGTIRASIPYASALMHVTVADALGPFNTFDTSFALAEFTGSVPLDSPFLPLPSYAQEFGDDWTHAITASADLTRLTYAGSISFDEIVDGLRLSGTYTATADLQVDNTYPRFDLQPLESDVVEGAATGARFLVTRSGNIDVATAMNWSVSSGNIWTPWTERYGLVSADFPATPGLPFGMPYGTVDFAPGQTTAVIEVNAIDDFQHEDDERFFVSIDPGQSDLFLGLHAQATGRIIDNDAPAFVSILPVATEVTEAKGATLTWRLHREGNLAAPADVWYVVGGDGPRAASTTYDLDVYFGATHIAYSDAVKFQVVFPEGATDIEISVPIIDDRESEPAENLRITLVDPSPGLVIQSGEATGTILPDEPVSPYVIARIAGTDTLADAVQTFYAGPVPYISFEMIAITPDNLLISTASANWFIRSGSGNDALFAGLGSNVLDGGTGSNFLTGGNGRDAYFLDIRDLDAAVWSTIAAFDIGDSITVWGLSADTPFSWQEMQGAPGYQGITLVASANGHVAAVTLANWNQAAMDAWRITAQFGHDPVSGADYLLIRQA